VALLDPIPSLQQSVLVQALLSSHCAQDNHCTVAQAGNRCQVLKFKKFQFSPTETQQKAIT
jgi:hypothetical protein